MSKPPLLYGSDGLTPIVADDSEDKLRAMLLVAFGALKGIHRTPAGTQFVPQNAMPNFQNFVATRIVALVGQGAVEDYFGIKLAQAHEGPEGVM